MEPGPFEHVGWEVQEDNYRDAVFVTVRAVEPGEGTLELTLGGRRRFCRRDEPVVGFLFEGLSAGRHRVGGGVGYGDRSADLDGAVGGAAIREKAIGHRKT